MKIDSLFYTFPLCGNKTKKLENKKQKSTNDAIYMQYAYRLLPESAIIGLLD